jgi:hypothetical protein
LGQQTAKEKRCPNCGYPINFDAQKCPVCKIDLTNPQRKIDGNTISTTNRNNSNTTRNNSHQSIDPVLSVILKLAICMVIFFVINVLLGIPFFITFIVGIFIAIFLLSGFLKDATKD